MEITYKQLEAWDACEPQRELFREFFGESVEITGERLVRHARRFDLDWLSLHVLRAKKARSTYTKGVSKAIKAYNDAISGPREDYAAALRCAHKNLAAVICAKRKAYEAATLDAYNAAIARALWAAIQVQEADK